MGQEALRGEGGLAVYRALFDASSDATVVVDEVGRILLANAACRVLLGREPEDLEGRGVEELVPARFRGHARQRAAFLSDPRARPMGLGLELFAWHSEGREIPVDISLSPCRIGDRQLVSCALRDLRGRVRGPESLRVQATALRSAANGVVITGVDANSAAAEKRLNAGDVIIEVAQEPVASAADVQSRIDQLKKDGRKSALFLVANAEGDLRFVALTLQ